MLENQDAWDIYTHTDIWVIHIAVFIFSLGLFGIYQKLIY